MTAGKIVGIGSDRCSGSGKITRGEGVGEGVGLGPGVGTADGT